MFTASIKKDLGESKELTNILEDFHQISHSKLKFYKKVKRCILLAIKYDFDKEVQQMELNGEYNIIALIFTKNEHAHIMYFSDNPETAGMFSIHKNNIDNEEMIVNTILYKFYE